MGYTTTVIDARPVALVDGHSLYWDELRPILSERSGGEALQEVILDRQIDLELRNKGMKVSEDEIARERTLLVETLHEDSDTAYRLLEEIRKRQRLGPVRFRNLLRRNASLRRLTRDEVQITPASLQRTFEILYGERRQVRLITMSTLADSEAAYGRVQGGEDFGTVATEISTDFSSARGGLLEPISRVDPGYAEALRLAIWKLSLQDVSNPILLDGQYALVQLVRLIPAQEVFFEDMREEVTRVTRLNQERLLMERLARQLLTRVNIVFFDDSVKASFRAVRGQIDELVDP
ncbi:MAG: hypothetical protein O7G85_15165 [Planctomycetota bacterium]|nr:hypothetical protein [Planctomycetota bacterium]